MINSNSYLLTLPVQSLAGVLDYLDVKDIAYSLNLTCQRLHLLITTSPYITRCLFRKLIGRKVEPQWNLNSDKIARLLKQQLSLSQKDAINLPYYGFRSNSGSFEDSPQGLFDKIFEYRTSTDPVCTRAGSNFDIQGVLSADFAKKSTLEENLLSVLRKEDLHLAGVTALRLRHLSYQSAQYGIQQALDELPDSADNQQILNMMENMVQLENSFKDLISSSRDKYNIILPYKSLPPALGLIKSCQIHRAGRGIVSCPVKTLVAFTSSHEISPKNPIVSLFSSCSTSQELAQILKEHKAVLPSLAATSIKALDDNNVQYKNERLVEYAVFRDYQMSTDVTPLFWAKFHDKDMKKFNLDLRKANASGKYVMIKMIECEDLDGMAAVRPEEMNIDILYCSFHGYLMYFSTLR